MHLQKIELSGFKSFAPKTTLEFPRGITAIVGPNGSGKSNVADAIRWVLGEQSLKLLRGKKAEDVIFSGSEKKGRLGFCEASLYLDNADQKMPIDFSHVAISRKLYRNGDSDYLVNKAKTTLQEIQYLLAKSNIGQKSYSVIGQGLIDQFLLSTPRERKVFFDEASGVKPFQMKRQQSLNKLEKALENLKQAEMIITELAPRLSTLTRQVKKLEQREALTTQLDELQYQYFGSLWLNTDQQLQGIIEREQQTKAKLQQLQSKLQQIQKQLGTVEQTKPTSSVIPQLQKEYEELFQKKMLIQQQRMEIDHKIRLLKQTPTSHATQLSSNQLTQGINTLSQESIALQNQIEQEEDAKTIKELIRPFFENFSSFMKRVKGESKPQEIKIPENLLSQQKSIQVDLQALETEIQETQKKMNAHYQKSDEQREELISLQHQFQQAQNHVSSGQQELNNIQIEKARLETKKEDLQQKILQDMGEMPKFQKEKIKEQDSSQHIYDQIQKMKRQLELIGGIDPEVVGEYEETKERHDFLEQQIHDLKETSSSLEKVILNLDDQIKKQFDLSFKRINTEFEKYFKMLFAGGKASLKLLEAQEVLENEEDEQEEEKEDGLIDSLKKSFIQKQIDGVEVEARPPGKNITSINMLSGGERALTSIALICAIVSANPSPFVVLDEVDAALDESNSVKFAHILEELSSKTQFIIITHNRSTMEKAKVLYGVTMGDDGISRLVSLSFDQAQKSIIANRA